MASSTGVALPDLENKPSSVYIWGALVVVYLVWGSTYLAIRVAIRTTPPLMMSGVRFLVAGGALYAFAVRRGDRSDRPTFVQWRAATIIGGKLLFCGEAPVLVAPREANVQLPALLVWHGRRVRDRAGVAGGVHRVRLAAEGGGDVAGVGLCVRQAGRGRVLGLADLERGDHDADAPGGGDHRDRRCVDRDGADRWR